MPACATTRKNIPSAIIGLGLREIERGRERERERGCEGMSVDGCGGMGYGVWGVGVGYGCGGMGHVCVWGMGVRYEVWV
jgi:hypothetical protein